jgi:hypothetical protein
MELDNIEGGAVYCSNIGATCRNVPGKAFHTERQSERQSRMNTS